MGWRAQAARRQERATFSNLSVECAQPRSGWKPPDHEQRGVVPQAFVQSFCKLSWDGSDERGAGGGRSRDGYVTSHGVPSITAELADLVKWLLEKVRALCVWGKRRTTFNAHAY